MNFFLGAGLCAMFAWWGADFLAGIGALVFFYGLGQTLIGSLPAIKAGGKTVMAIRAQDIMVLRCKNQTTIIS